MVIMMGKIVILILTIIITENNYIMNIGDYGDNDNNNQDSFKDKQ